MQRVSSSPYGSTAPTAKPPVSPSTHLTTSSTYGGNASPLLSPGGVPAVPTSSTAAAAAAPPQATVTPSPFLSPGDADGGLTTVTSLSGPLSSGQQPALIPTTAAANERDVAELASTGASYGGTTETQEKLLRARDHEIAHLRRTVQELASQLNATLHALDERKGAAEALQAFQEAQAADEERRNGEVRTVRMEMLESRVKYRTLEAELAATYEGDVQAKATELLASQTKEIHEDNFELLKEKLMLSQEVAANRVQYEALQGSYQRLRRETDLDGDAKKELLQRSVQQKAQIASLRQQVKTSEDNLNAVVGEYDRKLAEQERQHHAVVSALTRERDAARSDAMQLKRELQQLRKSAGTVLSQRSNLDDFFYAALDEVRRGVAEERRQAVSGGLLDSQQNGFAPAQTATSLLRLQSPERLRITSGSAGTPGAEWTVDRKGFPKWGGAAAATARVSGAAGSSASAALPPVAASARGSRSAPPAAHLGSTGGGALVSVPNATPAYLRPSLDGPISSSSLRSSSGVPHGEEAGGAAGAVPSAVPMSSGTEGGFSRDGAAEYGHSTSQQQPNAATPPTGALPALRSLPKPATWRDASSVDVASLSWADKERVIQLLFKRIKSEGQRRNAASKAKPQEVALPPPQPAVPVSARPKSTHFERDAESSTFLT